MLPKAQVEAALGKHGLRTSKLSGIPPSPAYNDVLYLTPKKEYALALQVWAEPTIRDTRVRFERMRNSYTNVQEATPVTAYTFFASWGDIYHLVFMDLKARRVAALSASSKVVPPHVLYQLAKSVAARLASAGIP